MDITLQIEYYTQPGEQVVLVTDGDAHPMHNTQGGDWTITLPVTAFGPSYHYRVGARREWFHHLLPQKGVIGDLLIRDCWQDLPSDSPFYSTAFTDVLFRRGDPSAVNPAPSRLHFILPLASIPPTQTLAITGSGPLFADWTRFLPLDDSRFPWWGLSLPAEAPFEYKYVILDRSTLKPLYWEEGPNRRTGDLPSGAQLAIASDRPVFRRPLWRGRGVAIPVFSLRTEDDFGVGEFHDIPRLVDWAVAHGMCVIQLLPVNDTTMTRTWQDSYPYNAVSSFALHPQYLHLPSAGVPVDAAYRSLRRSLNALPDVDYERVNAEKLRLLRKAWSTTAITLTPGYKAFIEANSDWLLPYAAFSALRDEYGTPDFTQWGKYSTCDENTIRAYIRSHPDETGFYCYLQYCLDAQLREAVSYAHSHGVILKGDLPIGVSRTSVDVWLHPELFHLDSQAGAPPDVFATDGQNWGFPTYNWDRMEQDGFAWWKARLRKMSEYFDAYRIDHILGFFRIWEIPIQYQSGLMGHFNPSLPYSTEELLSAGYDPANGPFLEDPRRPGYWHVSITAKDASPYQHLYEEYFFRRHEQFWKQSALRKLPALLHATGMLACGEDLGMIPSTVPETMRKLGILSLEIQRMPKQFGVHFADISRYPYLSVCATGTHDTSTIRGWWEEDRALTREYYHTVLHHEGEPPLHCTPELLGEIVALHLSSPSLLTILPLQDYLYTTLPPASERINIPANPHHYWRYRINIILS